MTTWPASLFEFAWFPNREDQLRDLAQQAEPEDWEYHHSHSDYEHPILFNYLRVLLRTPCR